MEFGRFAFAMIGHLLASFLYVLRRLKIVEYDAVVDATSILDHRAELRELWERRMMADDQASSSPSKPPPKEGDNEEEVAKAVEGETPKIANGFAKPVPEDNSETPKPKQDDAELEDNNNNCAADSLEEDNVDEEEYVEEKTYTSKLEQTLVLKSSVEDKDVTVEADKEQIKEIEQVKAPEDSPSHDVPDTKEPAEPAAIVATPEPEPEVVQPEPESVQKSVATTNEVEKLEVEQAMEPKEEAVPQEPPVVAVQEEVQDSTKTEAEFSVPQMAEENEKDDGFICVADALSQEAEDGAPESTASDATAEALEVDIPEDSTAPAETPPPPPTPKSEDAPRAGTEARSEMEALARGGLKQRMMLPGVQKTEQPYSTCTTETKIAMEIREMREREEELRLMREQTLLSPVVSPVPPKSPMARTPSPAPSAPSPAPKDAAQPVASSPGYRVSSVFGPQKGTTSPCPPNVTNGKESAVEREIRLAKDREEELRKQKGLPPREDDSYVKPSQVKSSQVRVFNKANTGDTMKQAATAKIQLEIEEQTQREMALREMGHIQTISQERTDSRVAKLKATETTYTNGNGHPVTNGNCVNGRSSPDGPKRSTPSPTGPRAPLNNGTAKGTISMQKFIASRGKETTFSAPRNGGPFQPREEIRAAVPPPMVKLKRNLSVESKIQQEIMEMKEREEELRKLHMSRNGENNNNEDDDNSTVVEGNGVDHPQNNNNNYDEMENGNGVVAEEEISPRHNKLIAQWEKRIQKAES